MGVMTLMHALLAFAPLAVLMTLTPGADFTLVLRQAISRGALVALATGLGVCAGVLAWGAAAAAGAAAVFNSSPVAYALLTYAGAAYLVYMGVRLIISTFRRPTTDDQDAPLPRAGAWRGFGQGLVTNLLNPKIGVFYVALIPQFTVVDMSPIVVGLLLAGLHTIIGLAFFAVVIGTARAARRLLARPSVTRALDRICGVALVAFGVGVATNAVRTA